MRRLLKLLLTVALASLLVAATATTVGALTGGLVSSATTSTAEDLPPLGTSVLTGSTVYADDGTTVLGTFSGPEIRRPVHLADVSKTLIKAVLDTEDETFYLHGGFDIPSTVRALVHDSSGGGLQGGSTITQQLVKQIYLSPARNVTRKIKEAVLASRLNSKYTKDQILEAYLNVIYLGDSAYGVEAAANVYFGINASQLNLPQSALLAGLIQDPTGYDPANDPGAARTRRGEVLGRMVHYGDITQAQADAANAAPLPDPQAASTETITVTNPVYDDYVSEVYDELVAPGSPLGTTVQQRKVALDEGGLKIVTGLDPRIQKDASAGVVNGVPAYLTRASGCGAATIG
ncbi:MAG TPA: biosynthetic peptidoglycan transglycosylase, partial [Acidimicrobiales bacterium]|nr:biosynthetic peptidoglycan transglycosylase [Acidimicrobiales bacterium]